MAPMVHGAHDGGDHVALGDGQTRIPGVADENDAHFIAVVPGFMFDGVVKNPRLPLSPLPGLVANPEAAALWNYEGRCTTSRTLFGPVCAGIRVLGLSTEYIVAGIMPSMRGCGMRPTASTVRGQRAQFSSKRLPS